MSQEEETEVEIERLSPASSRREGRPVHEFLRLRPSPFSQLTSPSQEGMTIEEEDGSNDSGDDNASGEDRYEMQQGENWLRLMKKEEANSILDFTQDRQGSIGSCTPLILSLEALGTIAAPTKDCYLCIDVDEAILVVKDMRLPSSCSKRKSNDIDDSNSDDDSVCGLGLARRLPGPTQWESVPRRQMRTLESGDRLCTSLIQTSNGFQPSPDGLILEYRKTYRKDTTKMDDSSDPLHFAKNDSPVAKKYTGQTSPQDDTPASNSVKTQPLTQLSQPNFLANGVNDDTPASNSVKTQPMTQLSQPNLLSSGVKAESDEAPEDLEEKSDKKDDPMDTVSDDGSDKSVEIVVAKSNGESMGSPNVGISTMFATQPNADLSDDDTTLGDEDDEEKKLDVAEEGEETTEKVVQKVARTEDTDTAMETLSNDGDGAPLAATQPAEAVESEIGDVRGKGSDQAKPPTMDAESEVFSPTLCGETEDPPIPSSKDTQTSEPLLTPAKEGNCSQQSDRSEPKLIEAGAAVEDQHMKDADEGKHVSLSDDDAKSGIQVPVSSSKGSSNLCETKVDGADRDPREESDDGSETDVSEVLLSEAPIPTAYAEKSNAKSPIDAKKPAMLGDDGSRPHEDSAANGEEEKKDNGNNCEPTSDDGVQSDSTEEKDTMVPNPRKREAESSETVIPATPKRPRTTQKDTEIPASITSSRRRKNLPLSESTPQNHSTRKRGRDNCRTGSPATNDLEQSIRVMTTGVQLSNAQKNSIEKLGGVLLEKIEDAASATHIIASDGKASLRRTPKLMIGLCKTTNIVKLDWLVKSAKAQKVLPTSNFLLLDDKEAEKQYHFSMEETLSRAEKMRSKGESLLGGLDVHVCSGVAGNKQKGNMTPPAKEFRLIVEAAGGKWLTSVPDVKKKGVDCTKMILVVSKVEKEATKSLKSKRAADAKANGAISMTTEQLFASMMTQQLDG